MLTIDILGNAGVLKYRAWSLLPYIIILTMPVTIVKWTHNVILILGFHWGKIIIQYGFDFPIGMFNLKLESSCEILCNIFFLKKQVYYEIKSHGYFCSGIMNMKYWKQTDS